MKFAGSAKPITVGLAIGVVTAVVPIPFNALLLGTVAVVWLLDLVQHRKLALTKPRFVQTCVALCVVGIAIVLPIKHLDKNVGPMNYERMPLDTLTRALYEDWKIPVHVYDPQTRNQLVAFRTTQPMTRLEVLEKLSQETSLKLRIRYCGTMATFLFGAHPSFTTLSGPALPGDQ